MSANSMSANKVGIDNRNLKQFAIQRSFGNGKFVVGQVPDCRDFGVYAHVAGTEYELVIAYGSSAGEAAVKDAEKRAQW